MREYILLSFLLVSSIPASAQWKKIADFIGTDGSVSSGEYITCIYFLDLPGPPRIGFVGTESELHKTTDGGKTWHSVWDSGRTYSGYFVSDIYFKDSITGWFSVENNFGITGDLCYRTTDGGETWQKLNIPNTYYSDGNSIYYSSLSNLLFLSTDTRILISSDLGDTWPDTLPYYAQKFSFWSPGKGFIPVAPYPYDSGFYLGTSNGGVTWDTLNSSFAGDGQVLPIPGTSSCFMADYGRIIVRRSDDYGRTWRILKDFGPIGDTNGNPIPHPAPRGTGVIRGDFSRLYIQTDSGMYVSTDSGVNWRSDDGPAGWSYLTDPSFYSAGGVTFAGMQLPGWSDAGGGLWEEVWPQSGVKVGPGTKDSFQVLGPFSNPSDPGANDVSVLVHYCASGQTITAQVYDQLGNPIGTPTIFTSDAQAWDRMPINAPGTSGTYYIHITVGSYTTTLGYGVN